MVALLLNSNPESRPSFAEIEAMPRVQQAIRTWKEDYRRLEAAVAAQNAATISGRASATADGEGGVAGRAFAFGTSALAGEAAIFSSGGGGGGAGGAGGGVAGLLTPSSTSGAPVPAHLLLTPLSPTAVSRQQQQQSSAASFEKESLAEIEELAMEAEMTGATQASSATTATATAGGSAAATTATTTPANALFARMLDLQQRLDKGPPISGKVWEQLGRAWADSGQFGLAIQAYRRSLRAKSANASLVAMEQLGNLLVRRAQQVWSQAKKGDPEGALKAALECFANGGPGAGAAGGSGISDAAAGAGRGKGGLGAGRGNALLQRITAKQASGGGGAAFSPFLAPREAAAAVASHSTESSSSGSPSSTSASPAASPSGAKEVAAAAAGDNSPAPAPAPAAEPPWRRAASALMYEGLAYIERMCSLGGTAERRSLLGSAYKRRAWTGLGESRKEDLIQAASNYAAAHELELEEGKEHPSPYARLNQLTLEMLASSTGLGGASSVAEVKEDEAKEEEEESEDDDDPATKAERQQAIAELEATSNEERALLLEMTKEAETWAAHRKEEDPTDVWLWVQAVDARCLRFLLGDPEVKAEEVIASYREQFSFAASQRVKSSVLDQLSFLDEVLRGRLDETKKEEEEVREKRRKNQEQRPYPPSKTEDAGDKSDGEKDESSDDHVAAILAFVDRHRLRRLRRWLVSVLQKVAELRRPLEQHMVLEKEKQKKKAEEEINAQKAVAAAAVVASPSLPAPTALPTRTVTGGLRTGSREDDSRSEASAPPILSFSASTPTLAGAGGPSTVTGSSLAWAAGSGEGREGDAEGGGATRLMTGQQQQQQRGHRVQKVHVHRHGGHHGHHPHSHHPHSHRQHNHDAIGHSASAGRSRRASEPRQLPQPQEQERVVNGPLTREEELTVMGRRGGVVHSASFAAFSPGALLHFEQPPSWHHRQQPPPPRPPLTASDKSGTVGAVPTQTPTMTPTAAAATAMTTAGSPGHHHPPPFAHQPTPPHAPHAPRVPSALSKQVAITAGSGQPAAASSLTRPGSSSTGAIAAGHHDGDSTVVHPSPPPVSPSTNPFARRSSNPFQAAAQQAARRSSIASAAGAHTTPRSAREEAKQGGDEEEAEVKPAPVLSPSASSRPPWPLRSPSFQGSGGGGASTAGGAALPSTASRNPFARGTPVSERFGAHRKRQAAAGLASPSSFTGFASPAAAAAAHASALTPRGIASVGSSINEESSGRAVTDVGPLPAPALGSDAEGQLLARINGNTLEGRTATAPAFQRSVPEATTAGCSAETVSEEPELASSASSGAGGVSLGDTHRSASSSKSGSSSRRFNAPPALALVSSNAAEGRPPQAAAAVLIAGLPSDGSAIDGVLSTTAAVAVPASVPSGGTTRTTAISSSKSNSSAAAEMDESRTRTLLSGLSGTPNISPAVTAAGMGLGEDEGFGGGGASGSSSVITTASSGAVDVGGISFASASAPASREGSRRPSKVNAAAAASSSGAAATAAAVSSPSSIRPFISPAPATAMDSRTAAILSGSGTGEAGFRRQSAGTVAMTMPPLAAAAAAVPTAAGAIYMTPPRGTSSTTPPQDSAAAASFTARADGGPAVPVPTDTPPLTSAATMKKRRFRFPGFGKSREAEGGSPVAPASASTGGTVGIGSTPQQIARPPSFAQRLFSGKGKRKSPAVPSPSPPSASPPQAAQSTVGGPVPTAGAGSGQEELMSPSKRNCCIQ